MSNTGGDNGTLRLRRKIPLLSGPKNCSGLAGVSSAAVKPLADLRNVRANRCIHDLVHQSA